MCYILYFKVVASTLDLYGNESDYFWMPLKTASTNLIPSVEGNFLISQQKKSVSMKMWLLMNMDMQTPHGIAQGWGLAAIVLCWSNLKLLNTPQSIFFVCEMLSTVWGNTVEMGVTTFTFYYNNILYMYDGLNA